ncbi:hypothetical protein HOG48_04955, partial [Candidatus Peregrinibacteria bacterium]|nr:hypothetical protein [Candidatus Peregrinibacteria bacterium]
DDDDAVDDDDTTQTGDLDGDGFTEEDGDCDDGNPDVHPGAEDTEGDGIDQNCDGVDGEVDSVDECNIWIGAPGSTNGILEWLAPATPEIGPPAPVISGGWAQLTFDGDIAVARWTGPGGNTPLDFIIAVYCDSEGGTTTVFHDGDVGFDTGYSEEAVEDDLGAFLGYVPIGTTPNNGVVNPMVAPSYYGLPVESTILVIDRDQ